MPKPATHAASMRRLRATERQRQALALRRAGASYEIIAQRLGYANRSNAYRAVKHLLDRQESELVTEYRQLNLQRLERALHSRWERAITGDDRAVQLVLRIIIEENRLLGIRAPRASGRPETVSNPPPVAPAISHEEWWGQFKAVWDQVRDSASPEDPLGHTASRHTITDRE